MKNTETVSKEALYQVGQIINVTYNDTYLPAVVIKVRKPDNNKHITYDIIILLNSEDGWYGLSWIKSKKRYLWRFATDQVNLTTNIVADVLTLMKQTDTGDLINVSQICTNRGPVFVGEHFPINPRCSMYKYTNMYMTVDAEDNLLHLSFSDLTAYSNSNCRVYKVPPILSGNDESLIEVASLDKNQKPQSMESLEMDLKDAYTHLTSLETQYEEANSKTVDLLTKVMRAEAKYINMHADLLDKTEKELQNQPNEYRDYNLTYILDDIDNYILNYDVSYATSSKHLADIVKTLGVDSLVKHYDQILEKYKDSLHNPNTNAVKTIYKFRLVMLPHNYHYFGTARKPNLERKINENNANR
jgi:hypothetical protein